MLIVRVVKNNKMLPVSQNIFMKITDLVTSLFSNNRKRRLSAVITLIVLVGGMLYQWVTQPQVSDEEKLASETKVEWSVVKRVVDGDTIELESGEKVRYIGINAPESVKSDSPVECFGKEASAYNKQLVEGQRVRLERDVSDRDKYGRLLRFVYLEDGTLVNDQLVHEGFAYVSTFPPDIFRASQFKQAMIEAREAKRGLWADGICPERK